MSTRSACLPQDRTTQRIFIQLITASIINQVSFFSCTSWLPYARNRAQRLGVSRQAIHGRGAKHPRRRPNPIDTPWCFVGGAAPEPPPSLAVVLAALASFPRRRAGGYCACALRSRRAQGYGRYAPRFAPLRPPSLRALRARPLGASARGVWLDRAPCPRPCRRSQRRFRASRRAGGGPGSVRCFSLGVSRVSFSGGLSRRCRLGGALVALAGWVGAGRWRVSLAAAGLGAVVLGGGGRRRLFLACRRVSLRWRLVGLGRLPAGGAAVRRSLRAGLRRLGAGGRAAVATAGSASGAACSGRVGAGGVGGRGFPLGAAALPPLAGEVRWL